MSLSRDWTALRFFNLILTDLNKTKNDVSYAQRFELMNKAVATTANTFYDLMSNAYMTPITLLPSTVGRTYVSGATWTAATNRLTATMNTSFGSGDVGNLIVFSVGASLVYVGTITQFISTTVVVVSGSNLPLTDQTVSGVLMPATTPTGQVLDITTLRLMRTGQPIKLELETTATIQLEACTSGEIFKFDTTDPGNANKIVWAYSGDQILLAKGSTLATYGTFTLRYPRIPNALTSDADSIDLPDGAAISISMLLTKSYIAERGQEKSPDVSAEMEYYIKSMYRTFGQEADAERVKEKVIALK